jgi:hypothetical protein
MAHRDPAAIEKIMAEGATQRRPVHRKKARPLTIARLQIPRPLYWILRAGCACCPLGCAFESFRKARQPQAVLQEFPKSRLQLDRVETVPIRAPRDPKTV